MDPTAKGILIGLFTGSVLALIGFGLSRIGKRQDNKTQKTLTAELVALEQVKVRDARIAQLEKDVQTLQAQAEAAHKAAIPITAAMEAMLISKLVNDHLPDADALLKKASDKTLTPEDAKEFAEMLKERETDNDPRIGEAQQIAADILPGIIRLRELAEEEEANGVCEKKTVLVTVPATDEVAARDGGTQEEEKDN